VLDKVILQLVSRPESSNVRAHVWDAVEGGRNPRVTDLDLRGYRSDEPGWIADRICCLSVAAEIRRMILGSEPAFERVRVVLENDPTTSELLLRCRSHMRRAHDSCHFPAALMPTLKPDSGRLTDNDIADTLTDRIAEGASPTC